MSLRRARRAGLAVLPLAGPAAAGPADRTELQAIVEGQPIAVLPDRPAGPGPFPPASAPVLGADARIGVLP